MAKLYHTTNTVIRTRQLLMYKDWVPPRLRFWLYMAFGFLYQYVGSINTSYSNQIVSEIALLNEDIQMAGYCTLGGITVCFPVMYRLKFYMYTRQLFFVSAIGIIICNALTMSVTEPWMIWGLAFIAGFCKMLGMFGCTSVFRLCVTPSRNYAVFFPVVYIMVCGGTYLSGITTAYLTYYGNWRLMNLFVIALMMIHCGIVYFMMKPDHRPGPFLSLKGVDFIGLFLWSAFLISGMWLFTYGEHYDWWTSSTIWHATGITLAFFAAALCRSKFHEKPYLPLSIFKFRSVQHLMLLLLGVGILQAAPKLLQSIYLSSVLKYDSLNTISLNWPILYGVVVGSLLAFATFVKWHWGFKKYFIVALMLLTFYEVSMYFLIDGDTNREAFFIPLFAFGVSEVMIGSASNVYLSQSLPFSHFFFGLNSIGYIRCGIGTALGSATVQRLYNWSISKNSLNAADNMDGTVMPFDLPSWSDTMAVISKQAVMISIKECYGYMTAIGIVMMMLIIIHHYRLPVIRLLPGMAAIRQWMNTEKTNDPKGSVIPNKAEEDDEDEEDDADCLEDKKEKEN